MLMKLLSGLGIYKIESSGENKLFIQGVTKNDTKVKEFNTSRDKEKYIKDNFKPM